DRINGNPKKFCPNAREVHIDIDAAEVGKIVTPDAYAIGDAEQVLQELLKKRQIKKREKWIEEVSLLKKAYPIVFSKRGKLKAQQVIEAVYRLSEGKAIVATDVGQHQMWAAQFYKTDHPDKWLSSG